MRTLCLLGSHKWKLDWKASSWMCSGCKAKVTLYDYMNSDYTDEDPESYIIDRIWKDICST